MRFLPPPFFLITVSLLATGPAWAGLLSARDQNAYRTAFQATRDGNYPAAASAASGAHDPLLAKVIAWTTYAAPESGAGFEQITAFIRDNPDWPQAAVLAKRAEEAITAATSEPAVRGWFDQHPPQTVEGATAYAKALLADGQQDKAAKVAREAWVGGSFGPAEEQRFLDSFQDLLRDQDQTARLDRLLWAHQDAAAERQIPRIDPAYRLLALARMALADDAADADAAAARVPEALKDDPGLIYERLRYARTHDKDEQAVALLSHLPDQTPHPEMWWAERAAEARAQLRLGNAAQAYEIARDHGQTESRNYAEAEWLAGWIALRFVKDGDTALRHFTALYERVTMPQSRSRAAYWAGRACDALGRNDDAGRWFETAARNPTTFYGQLAAARLPPERQAPFPADPRPTAADNDLFGKNELVRAARMLGEIGETETARPFVLRVNELAKTPEQHALTADLATSLGRADIAVAVARKSERDGVSLIASGYPVPSLATGASVPEKALVLGLIRQESAFYSQAVSPVGARGLMQLMPATARHISHALGMTFKKKNSLDTALTDDPAINVKLGSAYLNDLLSGFNGSYVLGVAAYNAGPGRVRRWLNDNGDPRSPQTDPVDWIESIPYSETRNYVQRVLEGVQVYRWRLGGDQLAASLDNDLKR